MKSYIRIPAKKILKRHFLLLEVMVAVFILLVCAAPAMRIYISMFKEQQAIIRENQRDHLVHLIHANITEKLYKRLIPLEEIVEGKSMRFSDSDLEKVLHDLSYECSYGLAVVHPKSEKGQEMAAFYLCKFIIKMKDVAFNPRPSSNRKRIENQDPFETVYEYYLYIDSGKLDKNEGKGNSANQTEAIPANAQPFGGSQQPTNPSFPKNQKNQQRDDNR